MRAASRIQVARDRNGKVQSGDVEIHVTDKNGNTIRRDHYTMSPRRDGSVELRDTRAGPDAGARGQFAAREANEMLRREGIKADYAIPDRMPNRDSIEFRGMRPVKEPPQNRGVREATPRPEKIPLEQRPGQRTEAPHPEQRAEPRQVAPRPERPERNPFRDRDWPDRVPRSDGPRRPDGGQRSTNEQPDSASNLPSTAGSIGMQFGWSGVVRNWYDVNVSGLDASDSFQRTFIKSFARIGTPGLVRAPIEYVRPELSPSPHPLGYVAELFPEGTGGPPGTANATNATASALGKGLRIGGTALIVVGVTWEAVQVYNSDNPARAGAGAVGAFGAGLVSGLVAGGIYGAAWGTVVPGPGNVVGGVVGGLVGLAVTGYASYVGSGYGRQLGYDAYDAASEHVSSDTH